MSRQTFDNTDEYSEIAEFYDLEHDQFVDDLAMYRQVVDMVGDPVVEFACGSGRILHAIALPERRLTGVDSSAAMLARCRTRFADVPGQPTILQQDMTEADLPEATFGVGIIGLNSLMHATTPALQDQTLRAAHRALDPRGLLVIDLFNPIMNVHDANDDRVRRECSFTTNRNEKVTKFSSQEIDLAGQTISTAIWYDVIADDELLRRVTTKMMLRFMYRSELELMLTAAGFASTRFYGTYELDPYSNDSPRLIAFAERS